MLVKLMTPKTDLSNNPQKSKPTYFLPADVIGIRPSYGSLAGGSIIATTGNPHGYFVRESPSLAHRKLFIDPAVEAKKAFSEFAQEPNDPPA